MVRFFCGSGGRAPLPAASRATARLPFENVASEMGGRGADSFFGVASVLSELVVPDIGSLVVVFLGVAAGGRLYFGCVTTGGFGFKL